jgi:hypothetical protein
MLMSAFISFVSCLDACLDAVGVRPPLDRAATVIGFPVVWHAINVAAGEKCAIQLQSVCGIGNALTTRETKVERVLWFI